MRILATVAVVLAFAEPSPGKGRLAEIRLTPEEARAASSAGGAAGAGTSGLAGVRTEVIFGDPAGSGLYSILLFVPAGTTIEAHTHRDDRVATVVAGDWHFGYGKAFDAAVLKRLPAGSVYSEPAGSAHFARTGTAPAIVQISGVGPTDTHYVVRVDGRD